MNSDTLRAVVDCLIPADEFPGAYDAGVCDYLERLLQTDLAVQTLAAELGQGHAQVVSLTGVYHNLLRMWAEV